MYELSIFYTNKCFLLAAHRCGKPELCTPVKQNTTQSSPSRLAPCSIMVSPRLGAAPGVGGGGLIFQCSIQAAVPRMPGKWD